MLDIFRKAILGAVIGFLIVPYTVVAQTIEEIVVTTRKKEENLQDVPVAITAFSSKVIEEARIENLDDVAGLTPGLNFFNPFGQTLPVPVIRGIAPTDIFGEPNAAVFVDGVYAAGREGLNFALLDVERIEVNKGPQSALYGRNAFSGAINYVTRRPTEEFSSSVEATAGNDGRYTGRGLVSGPLIENVLGASLGYGYDTFDGSYDNPLGNDDVGGFEYNTITSSIEWTPTENFSALIHGYYSDDEIDDAPLTGQLANCENVGPDDGLNERLANLCGEVWDNDQARSFINEGIQGNPNVPQELQFNTGNEEIAVIPGSTGEKRKVTRVSMNLDWDFDFGLISALSGYSYVTQKGVSDGTHGYGFAFPFVYCENVVGYLEPPDNTVPLCTDAATPTRFTTGELVISPKDTTKEFSQELKFMSSQDKAIRYSVGAYYFHFELDDEGATALGQAPNLPAGLGDPTGPGTQPPGAAFGPFVDNTFLSIGDAAFRPWFTETSTLGMEQLSTSETDSYSGFGTLDWDWTDQLTADFQLRYTHEEKSVDVFSPTLGISQKNDENYNFFTGKAGLRFNVSDDWMVYASASRGQKPGGFDVDTVDILDLGGGASEERIVIVAFDEEKLWSYEVGAKGTSSDGRFRYDLAVYRMNWDDIVIPQLFQNDPNTGDPLEQPEGFNFNAGDATVWGWEMQGDMAFTDSWFGGVGISYTDASMDNGKLESFADFPSFGPDGDISGNKVLRQPDWQANANVRYYRPLTSSWDFDARADIIYQDSYFGGLDNQWTIPSHTYVNLRLAVESERWSISLWGKNLFNDDSPIAAFRDVYFGNTDDPTQQEPASSTPENFFPWRITTTQPQLRTYGLTAKVKFGAAR